MSETHNVPMCGRFALKTPPAKLKAAFGLDEVVDFAPRFNIPPSTDIPVIRQSLEGKRVLHLIRWGLVPHWAKDPAIGNRLNNARSESAAGKPAFRDAIRRRRCLVPADGFYEWKAEGRQKLPYYISLKTGVPMAMAGMWESWRTPDGEILRTCCILTTGPNDVMEPIHDRMPVIIDPADYAFWLDPEMTEPEALGPLLSPYPADKMRAWPVSRNVNRANYEAKDAIEPIGAGLED